MNAESISLIFYVLVATFTPGPGNVASATMGMMYGYKRTLRFLSGIVSGYLIIMLLCAFLSGKLIGTLPVIEPVLRIVGAGYILWIAIGILRASYGSLAEENAPMRFQQGFLLQVLNPKAIIFGITLYTTFLSGYTSNLIALSSSAVTLAIVTFCSVSTWAFAGDRIQEHLQNVRIRKLVNTILFILLVYCAITLSGIHG